MESYSKKVKRARARTADAVLAAAGRLFVERGYVATTVEAIAQEAGVALQTVYNAFGSKAAVLRAVVEASVGVDGRPPREAVRERAAAAESGREMLRVAVDYWRSARPRSEPVFAVVREAARLDAEIALLEQELDGRKLASMRLAATDLEERGWLRSGLSVESASGTLWALSHPAAYGLLVGDEGWGEERYARWLEDALCAALLADPV
jgi:AcrR family transcriptional regulator